MEKSDFSLAIIVPVYKIAFLQKSLQSIENQVFKNFQVYIFDDRNTEEVKAICMPFVERNAWVFHRFGQSLGPENLAAHWNRCIAFTREPWIWLFSDDDEMSSDCTLAFEEAKKDHSNHPVLRFHQVQISEDSRVLHENFEVPNLLSGFEFGKLRFFRRLNSSAVEFIFSRHAFEKTNGFPPLPYAWCADDLAWIAFCKTGGMRTLERGTVFWRISSANVSADFSIKKPKMEAAVDFLAWFGKNFRQQTDAQLRAEQVIWLRLQAAELDYDPSLFTTLRWLQKIQFPLGLHYIRAIGDLWCNTYVYRSQVLKKAAAKGWKSLLFKWWPKF